MNYPKFDQFHRFCFSDITKKEIEILDRVIRKAYCTHEIIPVSFVGYLSFGQPLPVVYHIEACDQPIDFVLSKPRPSQVVKRAIKSLSVFDVSKPTKKPGLSRGIGFGFFDYTYSVSRKQATE